MTNDLARAWDEHAGTYARIAAPCTGYLAQSLFLTAAGRLPPGARILDIACGNGELAVAATRHCLAERRAAAVLDARRAAGDAAVVAADLDARRAAGDAAVVAAGLDARRAAGDAGAVVAAGLDARRPIGDAGLDARRPTGTAGGVVATDFSPEMVARTRRSLAVLDAGDLARAEVHDGQALGFDAASFDAVFSAFGIFLFPDRQQGWREAARVLRPGGVFATAVWRGPEDNALARLQMAPMMAVLPERVRASLPRPGWLDIASAEGLAKEIGAAGFIDPEVTVMNATLTAPTPRAMWAMMRENPLTRPLLTACSEEELAVVERSVLASFEALAGGPNRPVRFDASCHFLVARR